MRSSSPAHEHADLPKSVERPHCAHNNGQRFGVRCHLKQSGAHHAVRVSVAHSAFEIFLCPRLEAVKPDNLSHCVIVHVHVPAE